MDPIGPGRNFGTARRDTRLIVAHQERYIVQPAHAGESGRLSRFKRTSIKVQKDADGSQARKVISRRRRMRTISGIWLLWLDKLLISNSASTAFVPVRLTTDPKKLRIQGLAREQLSQAYRCFAGQARRITRCPSTGSGFFARVHRGLGRNDRAKMAHDASCI